MRGALLPLQRVTYSRMVKGQKEDLTGGQYINYFVVATR